MNVKKTNPVYDIEIELYMVPKMLRHEVPHSWCADKNYKTKQKTFGITEPNKYNPQGVLVVNTTKLRIKGGTLRSIRFRCSCCEKLISYKPTLVDKYDGLPYAVVTDTIDGSVAIVERRFVNINKRSAIFYIPVHKTCKEVLELNPLAYLPKLEEIAKTWNYTKFEI